MSQRQFEWVNEQRPDKVFTAGFDAYIGTVNMAIHDLMLSFAPRIEAWMKENALWTDRTGNARQSLASELETLADGYGVLFGFGNNIEYAVFLEFANQGRFAIVSRALDYWSPIIFAEVQRLFA